MTTSECTAGRACVDGICQKPPEPTADADPHDAPALTPDARDGASRDDSAGDVGDTQPPETDAPATMDGGLTDAPDLMPMAADASRAIKRVYTEAVGPPVNLFGESHVPPAMVSSDLDRVDFFTLGRDARPVHGSFVHGTFQPWTDPLNPAFHRDGIDATYWGQEDPERASARFDAVARRGDILIHYYWERDVTVGWQTHELGGGGGALKPAITHFGLRKLIAFQVDANKAGTNVRRFGFASRDKWEEWKTGTKGPVEGGIDATTLFQDGKPQLVRLVARGPDKRIVTATYDPMSDRMSDSWTDVPGLGPDGAGGTPTITTFGPTVEDYEIITPSGRGNVWKRSFSAAGNDPRFEELSMKIGEQVIDVDAVTMPKTDLIQICVRTATSRLLHSTIRAERR